MNYVNLKFCPLYTKGMPVWKVVLLKIFEDFPSNKNIGKSLLFLKMSEMCYIFYCSFGDNLLTYDWLLSYFTSMIYKIIVWFLSIL